jgi:hypothetical protein
MITIELSLLLVLLIITTVALFLCILNALYLLGLGKQISELKKYAATEGRAESGKSEAGITPHIVHDIISGLRITAGKYHVDSLVVSTGDGLLVASYGSKNPEYDAAYYSNVLTNGSGPVEDGVKLFEFERPGMPLIGIIRARTTPPDDIVPALISDIQMVFETQL